MPSEPIDIRNIDLLPRPDLKLTSPKNSCHLLLYSSLENGPEIAGLVRNELGKDMEFLPIPLDRDSFPQMNMFVAYRKDPQDRQYFTRTFNTILLDPPLKCLKISKDLTPPSESERIYRASFDESGYDIYEIRVSADSPNLDVIMENIAESFDFLKQEGVINHLTRDDRTRIEAKDGETIAFLYLYFKNRVTEDGPHT